jgi:hypothetical protein
MIYDPEKLCDDTMFANILLEGVFSNEASCRCAVIAPRDERLAGKTVAYHVEDTIASKTRTRAGQSENCRKPT